MESPTNMHIEDEQIHRIVSELEAKFERRFALYEMQLETLTKNSSELIEAFNAAKGAFTVLGWVAKAAKPILVFGTLIASMSMLWSAVKTAIIKGVL